MNIFAQKTDGWLKKKETPKIEILNEDSPGSSRRGSIQPPGTGPSSRRGSLIPPEDQPRRPSLLISDEVYPSYFVNPFFRLIFKLLLN